MKGACLMNQTTVTRAQLAQAFETGQPITGAGTLPKIFDPVEMVYKKTLDLDVVLILTANALGYPMRNVSVAAQVGRFLQVNYTPAYQPDPVTIIVLESGPEADEFHLTVLNFQKLRSQEVTDYRRWFEAAKGFVRLMVSPLWALQPTQDEANFVLKWVMLVAAKGDVIRSGPWTRTHRDDGPFFGTPNFDVTG
jgi:hypothetical protein